MKSGFFSKNSYFVVVVALSLLIYHCQVNNIPPNVENFGYTYFPLDSGLYRDYLVKTVNYKIGGITDSGSYYLREKNGKWKMENSGDTVLTINRYKRNSPELDWQIDSVISVTKNRRFLKSQESNIPYVKLVFPVRDLKEWNGNAYNSLGDENYHYSDVNMEKLIMDSLFVNTVKVVQKEFIDTIVYTIIKNEIYARGVGLIYKESINLNYCTENDFCIGKKIIAYGSESRQWIISYGNK
jgi:hypothetical protein